MNLAGMTQLFHVGKKMLTQKLCNQFPISKNGIGLVNWDFLLNNKLSIDSQLSLLKL